MNTSLTSYYLGNLLNLSPYFSRGDHTVFLHSFLTMNQRHYKYKDKYTTEYDLFEKHCFEKLELKFCKAMLGVHKKASNAAARGELGRYPTIIYILKQVLKNLFRIISYDQKQSIFYNTYMCNLEIH